MSLAPFKTPYHVAFLARVGETTDYRLKSRLAWRKDELAELLKLLNAGATKMEIAKAFPYRKWTRLRSKKPELKGKDFEVSGDRPMHHKES